MNKPAAQVYNRFIPYRKLDLIQLCLDDGRLHGDKEDFEQLCQLLSSIYHFEFNTLTESLKNHYAAIDPDSDIILLDPQVSSEPAFVADLKQLVEKANYEPLEQSDLNRALNESSLFKIRLQVNFSDYSEMLLYYRGESVRHETLRMFFGLYKKEIEFINYDRVMLYLRFRDDYDGDHVSAHCKAGKSLLKLFQNVPRADLEMLFPNTSVRMRMIDKLLIGVPALVSGGVVLTTKLGASLVILGSLFGFWLGLHSQPVELDKPALIALLAGAAALTGYLWKQFSNFKNRKLRFMQALTQNLYFKNLDNNAGVFQRLVNDAEEEECKEAILAYYFLLVEGAMPRTELDLRIETWLTDVSGRVIDFDIEDAVNKLTLLELLEYSDDQLKAIPVRAAIEKLNLRWDDFFRP